jgi:hypothetical protein
VGNLVFATSFIPPMHTQDHPYPFWFKLIEANLEALLTRPLHPWPDQHWPSQTASQAHRAGLSADTIRGTKAKVPTPSCPDQTIYQDCSSSARRRTSPGTQAKVPTPTCVDHSLIQNCSSSARRHAHRLDERMPQSAVKQVCKTHPHQNMRPNWH